MLLDPSNEEVNSITCTKFSSTSTNTQAHIRYPKRKYNFLVNTILDYRSNDNNNNILDVAFGIWKKMPYLYYIKDKKDKNNEYIVSGEYKALTQQPLSLYEQCRRICAKQPLTDDQTKEIPLKRHPSKSKNSFMTNGPIHLSCNGEQAIWCAKNGKLFIWSEKNGTEQLLLYPCLNTYKADIVDKFSIVPSSANIDVFLFDILYKRNGYNPINRFSYIYLPRITPNEPGEKFFHPDKDVFLKIFPMMVKLPLDLRVIIFQIIIEQFR